MKPAQVPQKLTSDNDTVLINTLGNDSFLVKHIPGPINIPDGEIEERAGQVLPFESQEIIVYCANPDCTASPTAAQKLSDLSYANIYDFEAGLTGWLKEGFRLIRA